MKLYCAWSSFLQNWDRRIINTVYYYYICIIGDGLPGKMRRKKTTDQYTEEKRWVFAFDLEEESEDECLTERGREFQITDNNKRAQITSWKSSAVQICVNIFPFRIADIWNFSLAPDVDAPSLLAFNSRLQSTWPERGKLLY